MTDCNYLQQGKCLWASKICNKLLDADETACKICIKTQKTRRFKKKDSALTGGVTAICIKNPHQGMSIHDMSDWINENNNNILKKRDMEIWWDKNKDEVLSLKSEEELANFMTQTVFPKTNNDLIMSSISLGEKLLKLGYTGVVGIPRSGFLPASIIATTYGMSLYSIDEDGSIVRLTTGGRGLTIRDTQPKIIAVDDTACSGNTAELFNIKHDIPVAVCYSTSRALEKEFIICCNEILEIPHVLEWNFFGSVLLESSYFDIDGVLSPNVPPHVDQDEDKYKDWLTNVEPIFKNKPHFFKIRRLVTGRFERYRSLTEQWLNKHGIEYEELTMFPNEKEQDRQTNHHKAVGDWKGDLFAKDSGAKFFIESELAEAEFIHEKARHKQVICTKGKDDFIIFNRETRYISSEVFTNEDLMSLSAELAKMVNNKGYTGIVGVPRSGLAVASVVATNLGLPLYSITNNPKDESNPEDCMKSAEIIQLKFASNNGGMRMENYSNKNEKLLVVDDSSGSGFSAGQIKKHLGLDLAVCFTTSHGSENVDYFVRVLENPHIFEWNFFASPEIEHTGLEIDGVMCNPVTWENETQYINDIENAKPLKFKPACNKYTVKTIVTSRPEKYRASTEKWLKEHGVVYRSLVMSASTDLKARHANVTGCNFFVMSDARQASLMKELCPNIKILTTNNGERFSGV